MFDAFFGKRIAAYQTGRLGQLEVTKIEARRHRTGDQGKIRPRAGFGAEPAAAGHGQQQMLAGQDVGPQYPVQLLAVRGQAVQAQRAAQMEMP